MYRWYVIHASSGSENRVKEELHAQFEKMNVGDQIQEILVPKKFITSMRRGLQVQIEERILPGYVLVHMQCTNEILQIIRNVPRVIGMLGENSQGIPSPLSEKEFQQLADRIHVAKTVEEEKTYFEIGNAVKVCDGPFSEMSGVVEGVDAQRRRLKVSISILGRATQMDLEFNQVEKII